MFDWDDHNYQWFSSRPTIVVHCDGAALRNGYWSASAGWGIWFQRRDLRRYNAYGSVPGAQTNQRAELMALREAIRLAPQNNHLIVRTDSRYAINCVSVWANKWQRNGWRNAKGFPVANQELIQDVIRERQRHDGRVILQYVPGHSGDYGNDAADALAKHAARNN